MVEEAPPVAGIPREPSVFLRPPARFARHERGVRGVRATVARGDDARRPRRGTEPASAPAAGVSVMASATVSATRLRRTRRVMTRGWIMVGPPR